MREREKSETRSVPDREAMMRKGNDLEKRYPVALVLYGILALLSWFTLGEGEILIGGRSVEIRLLPVIILGGFALRTVLALQAEKIRRSRD